MTKTLNQTIFFPSSKIRICFSATVGIRIFFLEKKHNHKPTYPRLSKEKLEHNLSIHERASIQVPSQTTTRVCLLCMGPLLTTRHIDALERVQRRAARFATNKYRNTSSVVTTSRMAQPLRP